MNMILTLSKHVIALMLLAGFSASAAPVDKLFDFDTPPDIPFWNATGAPDLSVRWFSGGFMEQRTFSYTESLVYTYPNLDYTGGGLSPTNATVLEARINVLRINGSAGVFFQAFDGAYRYSILLTPTGINIPTAPTAISYEHVNLDVFGFHTYRLESPANSPEMRLYYDGELVHVATAPDYASANGFNFGDGLSAPGNGGDATWDYVHFYQAPSLPSKLTVVSSQGGALPGTISADSGTAVNQWVTNSPVVSGTTRYLCTGGAVEGNAFTLASSTNITLTLTNNATLTWNWQTQYRLETLTEGAGTLTPASEWLDADAAVTLTATPDSGWVFDGWTGDTDGCAIDGLTITVPMSQARELKATFSDPTVVIDIKDRNLIAHYKLDGNAQDASTNAYHGTTYGAAPVPEGVDSGCYSFNGASTAILVTDPAAKNRFPEGSPVTISCWAKARSFNSDIITLAALDSGRMIQTRAAIRMDSLGRPYYYSRAVDRSLSSGALQTNVWYLLTATHEGSTAKLYVNGAMVAETNEFGTLLGPSSTWGMPGWPLPFQDVPASFAIGSWTDFWGFPSCIFDGLMDDVRFYNRALASDEVRGLYDAATLPSWDLLVSGVRGDAVPIAGTHSYIQGSVVLATVRSPVVDGTTRYVCTGATVEGNAFAQSGPPNVTLTLTNSATLTWNWTTQHRLETQTEGEGSVSVASGWLDAGTNSVLTATANSGAAFLTWKGDTNGCLIAGNTVTVPITQARSITAVFSSNSTPLASGLLLWNRLGDTNEVLHSSVGSGGTLTAGRFVPGHFGNALELNMKEQFGCTFPIQTLATPVGCLEFWAKLSDFPASMPTGASPGLIGWGMSGKIDGYVLFFSSNDGAADGGLCARTGFGSVGTGLYGSWTYSRAIGGGNISDWHHYAVTWSTNGIPGVADGTRRVATYVDGSLNSTHGPTANASKFLDLPATAIFGLLNHQGIVNGRVAFDNLKVWNFAKTDFGDRTTENAGVFQPHLTVGNARGDAVPANGTHSYVYGDAIAAQAPAAVTDGGTRYVCTGATVEGNAFTQSASDPTHVTLELTNNATLTWNWQTQYRLETLTEGAGTLTPASEWLDADAALTLTATPDSGWVFDGWTGDTDGCAIDGNAITVAMTRARSVTAQFDRETYAVTFDPEGGAVAPGSKAVTYGLAYGPLPAPTRLGFAFGGWWTGDNGTGTQVTGETLEAAASDHVLYALWAKAEYLCPAEGDAAFATAGSYDGYFYSDSAFSNGVAPAVRGVLTLRITGPSGKLTAKAMMRKGSLTFNRAVWRPAGADGTRRATLTASGGETLDLQVRQNRIWGTLAGGTLGETLALDGARNRFADRADAEAQALLSGFRGYYTVALPAYGVLSQGGANAAPGGSGYLTLTVGGGGRVLIAGVLADGTPVTQFASLILFDGCGPEACVALFDPLYSKKGGVGGLLWIDPASRAVVTDRDQGWLVHWEKPGSGPDGFGELLDACGGFYGTVPALAAHYLLTAETNAVPYAYGGPAALQTAALPDGIGIALDGPRLSIARGTRPVESGGAYDYSAENSAMASFAFTARTGIFRGRFNLYYDYVAGGRLRHASVSVPYAGVLTPVRGDAFAGEPSGQGYYLVPDSDPAVKAYRLQRSFLIELDAAP